ncbi:MAG: lysophospholipid acyltransferase family protein [Planctomycetota bacterium]
MRKNILLETFHSLWYKSCLLFSWIIALCFFRFRVYGRKNVPDGGGALIAANHQSYFDPPFVSVGTVLRPVHFLARQELFEVNWFFKTLISSLYTIPLERRTYDSQGLRTAIHVLKKGGLLLIFPEGGRSWNGELRLPKKGLTLIARKANVPIIPALIEGSYQAWPRRKTLPWRFYPIKIKYGSPIRVDPSVSPEQAVNMIYQSWKDLKSV